MKKYSKNTIFIARLTFAALLFQNCGGHQNIMLEPKTEKQNTIEEIKYNEEVESLSLTELPSVINLPPSPGQGLTVIGAGEREYFGYSVSSAGDINGDGIDDVVIGAPYTYDEYGSIYILYGNRNFPSIIHLSRNPSSSQGVTITGHRLSRSGSSVSRAGDVNGDGFADIIIGAPMDGYADNYSDAGSSYIVYGNNNLPSTINLYHLGKRGVEIKGIHRSIASGYSVSGAGDVNGDGFADVIVGAPYENLTSGASYIIYGNDKLNSSINLPDLGSGGVTIHGEHYGDYVGYSVSEAGDVNNDGFSDVIIGAPNRNKNRGASYIVYGSDKLPSTINVSNLTNQGITINGINTYDYSGSSVSGAGDVNGDGFADVIVGAPNAKEATGISYIVYGSNKLNSTINLAGLGRGGVTIYGVSPHIRSGYSVSGTGDVNGDGFADVIVGAPYANNDTGASYLVYGSAKLNSTISLSDLGSQGVTFNGKDKAETAGYSVSGVGDVNGDGIADVIIGAPFFNVDPWIGRSYIVYGESTSKQVSIIDRLLINTKRLCNNLSSWWYAETKQNNIHIADKIYLTRMLSLKDKCQVMLASAARETDDVWYGYSLEDIIEDIDAILKNNKDIDKYTVKQFKKRLAGIQKDFLESAIELNPKQKDIAGLVAKLSKTNSKQLEQMQLLAADVINSVPYPTVAVNALP